MKRTIDWHLKRWKEREHRKPPIVRGARQVGKTYAVRRLGKTFDRILEVNFELTPDAKSIFLPDLKPDRIVRDLGFYSETKIIPGKTLLFFNDPLKS